MTRGAMASLIERLPDGVRQAALPTPFPVGPVNCYLLTDDPVTLVDPGMLWGPTTTLLEGLLGAAGLRLRDVDQVVITHGHPDQFGAAGWVAEQADARILCGRPDRPKVLDPFGGFGTAHLLESFGVPAEVLATFPGFADGVRDLVHAVHDEHLVVLDDGDELVAGGRRLRVVQTPGHSVGHVSLWDAETATLLSGDHLLADITPNPVLEPDDNELGRRRSLVEYLDSLDRFIDLDPHVVAPGHGSAFTDLDTWATTVRAHHQRRAAVILDIVRELGEATPFELSQRLFPSLDGFNHILGVSEVAGHLDLLSASGSVTCDVGSLHRYAAA